MKQWQVDAIRRIENAAAAAKRQVVESTNDYDYITGELDVWMTSQVEIEGDYYTHYRLTNKIYVPL